MSRAHREGFGTALGPYTGADLADWHLAALADEAEQARLAKAAPKPTAARREPAAKRHLRWHRHAAHSH